jgi:hypothetical protein
VRSAYPATAPSSSPTAGIRSRIGLFTLRSSSGAVRKIRYRLIARGNRRHAFYCLDSLTGKRTSLGTSDRDAAEQIVLARNQSLRQPTLNLQIARAYLAGSDSGVATRTWAMALEALSQTKKGSTRDRWVRAGRDQALADLLPRIIMETRA